MSDDASDDAIESVFLAIVCVGLLMLVVCGVRVMVRRAGGCSWAVFRQSLPRLWPCTLRPVMHEWKLQTQLFVVKDTQSPDDDDDDDASDDNTIVPVHAHTTADHYTPGKHVKFIPVQTADPSSSISTDTSLV